MRIRTLNGIEPASVVAQHFTTPILAGTRRRVSRKARQPRVSQAPRDDEVVGRKDGLLPVVAHGGAYSTLAHHFLPAGL